MRNRSNLCRCLYCNCGRSLRNIFDWCCFDWSSFYRDSFDWSSFDWDSLDWDSFDWDSLDRYSFDRCRLDNRSRSNRCSCLFSFYGIFESLNLLNIGIFNVFILCSEPLKIICQSHFTVFIFHTFLQMLLFFSIKILYLIMTITK